MKKIFYSKSMRGFYEEAIHGARTYLIDAPDFVHPMIKIADPDYVASMNFGEQVPMMEVPDMSVEAPQVEVENELCCIPSDAVEITEQQWIDLLEQQAQGKVIEPGLDGYPVARDAPQSTEQQVRFQRDAMIAATDWTQLSDVPVATKNKWKAYRQELRDITGQSGFPVKVNWPVAPS